MSTANIIKFFKFLEILVLFHSYWLITTMLKLHAKKDKSEFFIYLALVFYSALVGAIGGLVLPYLLDFPYYPPEILGNETDFTNMSSVSSDIDRNKIELEYQKHLESQKQLEETREHTIIWITTVLIVYYVIFFGLQ